MFPNPDNWITGNWGEDSVPDVEENSEMISSLMKMYNQLISLRDEFQSLADLANMADKPIGVRASAFEKIVAEINATLEGGTS